MIAVILLLGCGAEEATPWSPDSTWSWAEEPPPTQSVAEGLGSPQGLARVNDVLWVVDKTTGELLSIEGDTLSTVAEGLVEPTHLSADEDLLLVGEAEDGRVLAITPSGEISVLAEDTTATHVALWESTAYWTTDNELWQADLSTGDATLLVDTLDAPTGLVVGGDRLWISDGDNARELLAYDPQTDELTEIASFGDRPEGLAWADDTVWLSLESDRWPYGGAIVSVDDGGTSELSYTPPEPSRVAVDSTHVYWLSKQTITRVVREGGTYEVVAIQTSPGDLVVDAGQIWWTDTQRGLVLTVEPTP